MKKQRSMGEKDTIENNKINFEQPLKDIEILANPGTYIGLNSPLPAFNEFPAGENAF